MWAFWACWDIPCELNAPLPTALQKSWLTHDMNRTDTSLVALRRILRATELYSIELARAAGLTAVQLRVLQLVAETQSCTSKAISQRLLVSQATVTALVDKLVRYNLVCREQSTKDRRHTIIVLTESGRDTIERAPDALQKHYANRFEALEDWEQSMLIAALERVASMLGAEDDEAAPVLGGGAA